MSEWKELGEMWLKDNLKEERKKLREVEAAYNSLKNKDSDYAKSIKRLLDVRLSVVDVWIAAAANP